MISYEEGNKFCVSSSSPEFLSELLGASVCMQLHFKNRWKSFYDMSYNNVSKQVRLNWVQYTFEIFTTTLLKFLHEFLPSWYSASLLCTHEHWHTWSSHMRNLIFFRVWAMPMNPIVALLCWYYRKSFGINYPCLNAWPISYEMMLTNEE